MQDSRKKNPRKRASRESGLGCGQSWDQGAPQQAAEGQQDRRHCQARPGGKSPNAKPHSSLSGCVGAHGLP